MDPVGAAVGAVIGYAIGSVQILALEWWRKRSKHRTQLRLLRAELRRLAEFQIPFGWDKVTGPPNDQIPRPPEPTENFLTLIGEIDFYLTDEHHDDNTQFGLLNVADGCRVLAHYAQKVEECVDNARASTGPTAKEFRDRAVEYSESYDKELARLQATISSALHDCERRLAVAKFWHQLTRRPLGDLPAGANPPPLAVNDPRVTALPRRRDQG